MSTKSVMHEFVNKIQEEAVNNTEFREKLLTNPRAAIEELLKIEIPENFEISIHQDTPEKINIVVPLPNSELSEADLEKVAGGVYCPRHIACPTFLGVTGT